MTENFVLLYNTLGYEPSASKRCVVRSIDPVDPAAVGSASSWTLLDRAGHTVRQGTLTYFGLSFGLQCWTLDFSDVRDEGVYTLHVRLTDPSGEIIDEDHSEPFLIGRHVYSRHILLPITIENALMRRAQDEYGGGYFDCNSQMGEARSHGVFLNGLVNTWALGRDKFTPDQYRELQQAANVAFDFLIKLHDDATGEFLPSYHSFPNQTVNLWAFNTYEALWGFSAYLHYFKDVEPERTGPDNYRRAVQSVQYVLDNMTDEMAAAYGYPRREFMAAVYYHLYKYSGDAAWMDKGIALCEDVLTNFDLRNICREGRHAMPMLEGVYLFAAEKPELPGRWMKHLLRIKADYYDVLIKRNAFMIQPVTGFSHATGVPIESCMEYTTAEWDDMASMPHDSCQYITRRAANTMDACYLGELTGDPAMEAIATAELSYAMGLNQGIEKQFVENPPTERRMAAAAMLANFNRRHSGVWYRWEFPRLIPTWMSFMNGFVIKNGEYLYDTREKNSWRFSETFIKHDGAFARAICAYERYLDSIHQ